MSFAAASTSSDVVPAGTLKDHGSARAANAHTQKRHASHAQHTMHLAVMHDVERSIFVDEHSPRHTDTRPPCLRWRPASSRKLAAKASISAEGVPLRRKAAQRGGASPTAPSATTASALIHHPGAAPPDAAMGSAPRTSQRTRSAQPTPWRARAGDGGGGPRTRAAFSWCSCRSHSVLREEGPTDLAFSAVFV